jgi:hypothetical protein
VLTVATHAPEECWNQPGALLAAQNENQPRHDGPARRGRLLDFHDSPLVGGSL